MQIVVRDVISSTRKEEMDDLLSIPLGSASALQLAFQQISGRKYHRQNLVDILLKYNQQIGNDLLALENIQKLKQENSYCVFTGQQLGFMTGPSYTILKAISCLKLAKKANAIPIFWLATEDHDVAEIDHTYSMGIEGNLHPYHLTLPRDRHFVEDLKLESKQLQQVEKFLADMGLSNISFPKEKPISYTQLMTSFLVSLFAGTGLVFVEPYLLRLLSVSFFQKELKQSDEIFNIMQSTTQKIEALGEKPEIKFEKGTNLFLKVDGLRQKIERDGQQFYVKGECFSESTLIKLTEEHPELFSTNVVARPVLQSLLFPTLAYVAGPSEVAYYHQLKDYHSFHKVPMPWIVPRLSATMILPDAEVFLQKCQLNPWEKIPSRWDEIIPSLGMNAFVHDLEKKAQECIKDAFSKEAISRIKKNLYKDYLTQNGLPSYALHYLNNLIYPHSQLQERVLNWYTFQSETKENLVMEFLKSDLDYPTHPQQHLYCYI